MRVAITHRLSLLLKGSPGESRLVAPVLVHSALGGFTRVFNCTAASALCSVEFEDQTLLNDYIGMSLVVTLLFFAYLKLRERLPLPGLLMTQTRSPRAVAPVPAISRGSSLQPGRSRGVASLARTPRRASLANPARFSQRQAGSVVPFRVAAHAMDLLALTNVGLLLVTLLRIWLGLGIIVAM